LEKRILQHKKEFIFFENKIMKFNYKITVIQGIIL